MTIATSMATARRGLLTAVGLVLAAAVTVHAQSGEKADAKEVEKKLEYRIQPPPATFSPPIANVIEPVFEWGTVMQGEVVKHAFEIENKGQLPLKVERVKPACGCTTSDYDKVIAPGEKGSVTLSVDTKRFTGTIKKTASVYTNAGREPYTLTMTGAIETPLEFDPKIPRIDVIRGSTPTPLEITVRKTTTKPLEFLGVEVEKDKSDILQAELNVVDAGTLATLKVTPQIADESQKYYTVEVSTKVSIEGKPQDIPVRVSIRVRDRIEATPPSVYFTRRDTDNLSQGPATRTVTVETLDPEHTFKITQAKVLGSNFKVSVKPLEDGKKYELTATLEKAPEGNTRRLVEKIVISTDDELVPEITLNCTASFALQTNR